MKENNNVKKQRIEWVDNAKAFACLLVTIGHLLQSLLKITPSYLYKFVRFINYSMYLFHMPLFMCLSGFLYSHGKKIQTKEEYKKFIVKKSVNLLVPYTVFYVITMTLNILFASSVNTPKGVTEWLGMINNPIPPYWFLYALLAIFIVTPIIEKNVKREKDTVIIFAVLKIISIFISTKVYFIDSIMKHGIYFYLGKYINEQKTSECKELIKPSIIYALLSIFSFKYIYEKHQIIYGLFVIPMAILGIELVISYFKASKKNILLNSFKKYTFQIFLMHTIFAAGIRIIMYNLGINNYLIHLSIGLLVSIYAPVIVGIISDKLKFTNFVFFPMETIKEYKKGEIIWQKKN